VVAELKLHKTLELGSHILFVGQILNILANEDLVSDGELVTEKVDPLVYGMGAYFRLGPSLGKAFSIGKKLVKTV
jgi:flavin reductase (DIM6/NTAB) family NADH-FMN oxidoreductase RutF